MKKKLSSPQIQIIKYLQLGAAFRPSHNNYFYGNEMTLKGGEKKYFRNDTVNALLKMKILVTHPVGKWYELNPEIKIKGYFAL